MKYKLDNSITYQKLAFESYGGDPDDSDGTSIWMAEIEN